MSTINKVKHFPGECYMCEKKAAIFTCGYCLQQGNTCSLLKPLSAPADIKSKFPDHLVLNQLLLTKLNEVVRFKRQVAKLRGNDKAAQHVRHIELQAKQVYIKDRIDKLNLLAQQQRVIFRDKRKKLATAKYKNELLNAEVEKKVTRIKQLHSYMRDKKNGTGKLHARLKQLNAEINTESKFHMEQLNKWIFPIGVIKGERTVGKLDIELCSNPRLSSLKEELEEARNMEFVCGRWVTRDRDQGMYICHPSVKTLYNGDWSKYEHLLDKKNKQASIDGGDNTSSTTSQQQKKDEERDGTGVALCHASQMLYVMESLFRSMRIEHRFHYRKLCEPGLSGLKFRSYAKLASGNVVALCIQQGISPHQIDPHLTLANLKLLVERVVEHGWSEKPLTPAQESDNNFIESFERALEFDDIMSEVACDVDDATPHMSEWEEVAIDDAMMPQPPTSHTSTTSTSSILDQPQALLSSALSWATRAWWTSTTEQK